MLSAVFVSAAIAVQTVPSADFRLPVTAEFRAASETWLDCLFDNLREFVDAPETAEAAAGVAMTRCSTEFERVDVQLLRDAAPYYDDQSARRAVDLWLGAIRENARQQLMEAVTTARVRRSDARGETN